MQDRLNVRVNEQKRIQTALDAKGFGLITVGGRSGLGKSLMVRELFKGREGYFLDVPKVTEDSLKTYWRHYVDFDFEDWDAFFQTLGREALEEPRYLVIRHFERLLNDLPEVEAALRRAIREDYPNTFLKIVLIDTFWSDEERPRSLVRGFYSQEAQLKLELAPFDYRESLAFLKKWSPEEALYAYSITGGVYDYLTILKDYPDLDTALREEFLRPEGGLRREPDYLLSQSLREPHVYNALLLAMAGGAERQKDIAEAAVIQPSSAANYLRVLVDLGIIDKKFPYKSRNPRLLRYGIREPLFRFCYHFLPRLDPLCQRGYIDEALSILKEQLPKYFNRDFRNIAKDFLLSAMGRGELDGNFDTFETWWNDADQTIDLLGSDANTALLATCLWDEEKMDLDALEELRQMSRLTQRRKNKIYFLFSRSGFTDELIETSAASPDVHLISLFGDA